MKGRIWSLRGLVGSTALAVGLGMGSSLVLPAVAQADAWEQLPQFIEQANAMYPTTPMAHETQRETDENNREQVENNREEDADAEEMRENEVIRETDQAETNLEGERRKGRYMLDMLRVWMGLGPMEQSEGTTEEAFNECGNAASILALVLALLAL